MDWIMKNILKWHSNIRSICVRWACRWTWRSAESNGRVWFARKIQKSKYAVQDVKHLRFIVTQNWHSLEPKKIQGLVSMKEPKSERQFRRFLGGTNFYSKMCRNRSHALVPLTVLRRNVPPAWKDMHHKAFYDIKAIMSKETMLCYQNKLPF